MPARKRDVLEGTLDFETDPFMFGRIPQTFACGIYFPNNGLTKVFWGSNCQREVVAYLRKLPRCTLYVHNGGKFDFWYLLPYAKPQTVKIVNGRLMSFQIGKVRLIDTFPLMPFSLASYKKTEINYEIFEEERRDWHRDEIEKYLMDDCIYLFELVKGFKEVVGERETIAGAAFQQMKKSGIKIEKQNEHHDDKFRPFYFGGRVQAFRTGIFRGPLSIYDINSAYPYAMTFDHPAGSQYVHTSALPTGGTPYFAVVSCESVGAFPIRAGDGSLDFPADGEVRKFHVTSWELDAARELNNLKILKVHRCLIPEKTINFTDYVDKYFAMKAEAKKSGDKIKELAFKYLLNSAYGKWGQDPRKFKKYKIEEFGKFVSGFVPLQDFGSLTLWACDAPDPKGFYDVAVGASITGFVRAMLWRAICASKDVYYCDTDSIICRSSKVSIGPELGKWKLEMRPKKLAVAGKKMYAAVGGDKEKTASKGVRISAAQIFEVARGGVVDWHNDAPSFSFNSLGPRFVSRKVRRG